MKKFRWAVAACLVATLCAPVAALADSGSNLEKQTVRVSYNDLNINSPDGARQLYTRLKRASKSVCGVGSYLELGSINRAVESKHCYRETLDQAVDRINSNQLELLHNS